MSYLLWPNPIASVKFIRASWLKRSWESHRNLFNVRGQDREPVWEIGSEEAQVLLFISHRWRTPVFPDPLNTQVETVLEMLERILDDAFAGREPSVVVREVFNDGRMSLQEWATLCVKSNEGAKFWEGIGIWYDHVCVPQRDPVDTNLAIELLRLCAEVGSDGLRAPDLESCQKLGELLHLLGTLKRNKRSEEQMEQFNNALTLIDDIVASSSVLLLRSDIFYDDNDDDVNVERRNYLHNRHVMMIEDFETCAWCLMELTAASLYSVEILSNPPLQKDLSITGARTLLKLFSENIVRVGKKRDKALVLNAMWRSEARNGQIVASALVLLFGVFCLGLLSFIPIPLWSKWLILAPFLLHDFILLFLFLCGKRCGRNVCRSHRYLACKKCPTKIPQRRFMLVHLLNRPLWRIVTGGTLGVTLGIFILAFGIITYLVPQTMIFVFFFSESTLRIWSLVVMLIFGTVSFLIGLGMMVQERRWKLKMDQYSKCEDDRNGYETSQFDDNVDSGTILETALFLANQIGKESHDHMSQVVNSEVCIPLIRDLEPVTQEHNHKNIEHDI
jgi:hypothetical protein